MILGGTTGVFALGGVVLASFASAMGNRLQDQLWPDWPFDAPTNVRLMPNNRTPFMHGNFANKQINHMVTFWTHASGA